MALRYKDAGNRQIRENDGQYSITVDSSMLFPSDRVCDFCLEIMRHCPFRDRFV
jgi:hypothetical protein